MMSRAPAPEIRGAPADIDASWLTTALRHAGHDVEVASVSQGNVGTGQVGQNVRFELTYAHGQGPRSVVGKFASDDPVSRQTGVALLNYLREVRFYQELDPFLDIRTPEVLFTDIDLESHEFVLLMEDLAPAEQGDQLAGCDAEAAELALVELAGLHGPRWGDLGLFDLEWIGGRDAEGGAMVKGLWDSLLPGFLERYATRLEPSVVACAEGLHSRFGSYAGGTDGPKTVVHGDYRLDNMLFGGPYPLAVVDWQSPALGNGPADAAYFMGTSMDPEPRRGCERRLVERYFETLCEYGIGAYDFDACWNDYRRGSFAGLVMAVIASMIVGQTERGDTMFMAMAHRSAAMANDLDALGLLETD